MKIALWGFEIRIEGLRDSDMTVVQQCASACHKALDSQSGTFRFDYQAHMALPVGAADALLSPRLRSVGSRQWRPDSFSY
ncbi:MAG: hypothetical protein SFV51_14495 [Bryobacteraceae bacterium]|nr:hypothetical protein [Bryobacteraceae bacterium]